MNQAELLAILRHRTFPALLTVILVDVAIAGIIAFVVWKSIGAFQELETRTLELDAHRSQALLIRNNRALLEGKIDDYNKLLLELIPSEETYFSVIATLERLAANTGVSIASYSINLQDTSEDKMTLSLAIFADEAGRDRFIRDYRYASGRLLISDSFDLSLNESSFTFSITMMHRPQSDGTAGASGGVATIEAKDIQYLEDIKRQMNQ